MVIAWPFLRKGWTSNGGRGVSIAELYFTKAVQTSSSYSPKVSKDFWLLLDIIILRLATEHPARFSHL
jgi:hypothetical protein